MLNLPILKSLAGGDGLAKRGKVFNFLAQQSLPLFLLCFSLVGAVAQNQLSQKLEYNRAGVVNGEVWRLITGNFMHLGWGHLLLNLLGLLLVYPLFSYFYSPSKCWAVAIFSSASIGICLFLFSPEVEWYVGLSGLLHALFAAAILSAIEKKLSGAFVLLFFLLAKLAVQGYSGSSTLFSAVSAGDVVLQSHIYGVASGVIAWVVLTFFKLKRSEEV